MSSFPGRGGYRAGTVSVDADEAIERWFTDRGLPHLVDHRPGATQVWGRAFWLLVGASVLRGLLALDLWNWGVVRNAAAAAIVIVVLVGTWFTSNLVRRRPITAVPRSIGPVELGLFLFAPAVPSMIFGQWDAALGAVALGVVLLVVIYVVTSYGIIPLVGWAAARAFAQLTLLGDLVVRALPLLLLFTTFLFINAEVWQVAGTLQGPAYVAVLTVFFALGSVFVLSRIPPLMRHIATFDDWGEVSSLVAGTPADRVPHPAQGPCVPDRFRPRERFNLGLVTIFSQAIQITLVAATVTGFFVLFGILAISADVAASWTTNSADDIRVLATWSMSGRDLVITEPLLRVAGFLGAFTGMYFTVVLSTDDTYRREFADDVAPRLREAIAVRAVYRHGRAELEAAPLEHMEEGTAT